MFSQIKDIKHIERDFHLVAWVMPQGVLGGQKFKFSEHCHVAYKIERDDEKNRIQVKFSP